MLGRGYVVLIMGVQLCIIVHLNNKLNGYQSCGPGTSSEIDTASSNLYESEISPTRKAVSLEDAPEELKFCVDSNCERMVDINVEYNSIFLSEEELTEKLLIQRQKRKNDQENPFHESMNTVSGDGDSCCSTTITFTKNETVLSDSGLTRTVVNTPPKYQWVPSVSCVKSGCSGRCVIEYVYINLLVHSGTPASVRFEMIEVPGYCSCKNTY